MSDFRQMLMDVNPVSAMPGVPDGVRQEVFAEVRRTSMAQPVRRDRRKINWRLPLPAILIPMLVSAGAATGAGLYWAVSEATKEQSASLSTQPAVGQLTQGTAKGVARVVAYAERVSAQTPWPPNMPDPVNWNEWAADTGDWGVARGAVHGVVEHVSSCLWRRYYIAAKERGDEQGARDAVVILKQAVDWPTVKGGGDFHDLMLRAAKAAERGDTKTVRDLANFDCREDP